ncbi:hypothetical protein Fmac_015403 [Flemingia macrophylla]|uniref:cellulase n=1 Tax=Flemingia macrophylla TaxID=520843 RepID=A0ABD1MGK7_9FABA
MTEARPLIQVNASCPGSDVAFEAAAAHGLKASLVFKKADSTYSSTLLKHAKLLFSFANKNRGSYSENIPEVQTYYNSTGYGDELLWAASGSIMPQVLLARLSFFKAKDISNSYGSGLVVTGKPLRKFVMCGLLLDSPMTTKSENRDSNILLKCYKTVYLHI